MIKMLSYIEIFYNDDFQTWSAPETTFESNSQYFPLLHCQNYSIDLNST